MQTPLFVIIPTSGRADLMRRTLQSLAACVQPETFAGVFVIENGGGRDSESTVVSMRDTLPVTYLFEQQPGKSRALNLALGHVAKICPDGLAVFADNDVRFDSTWLTAYATAHAAHPDDFLGGAVVADYVKPPEAWLVRHLPYSARGWTWDGTSDVVDQPIFLGFNWAARTRDLLAVGGFPTHLGPGASTGITVGDEPDVQRKLLAMGRTGRFLRDATVHHHVPTERCNPEWALQRTYVMGLCAGAHATEAKLNVGGVPAWMIARYAKGIARYALSKLAPATSEFRFFARKRQQFNRGLLKGAKLRASLPARAAGGGMAAAS